MGGLGFYFVVDEKGDFKEENFNKLKVIFERKEVGGNEIDFFSICGGCGGCGVWGCGVGGRGGRGGDKGFGLS